MDFSSCGARFFSVYGVTYFVRVSLLGVLVECSAPSSCLFRRHLEVLLFFVSFCLVVVILLCTNVVYFTHKNNFHPSLVVHLLQFLLVRLEVHFHLLLSMPYSKKRTRHVAFRTRSPMRKRQRVHSKRKPSLKKKVERLQKSVKHVKDIAENGVGHKTYRERFSYQFKLASTNTAEYQTTNLCGHTSIVRALNTMFYFDPSDPGNLISANGSTGTYQREYLFDPSFVFMARNNTSIACKLRCYLLLPKTITMITPSNAVNDGLNDKGSGLLTSTLAYPTDSEVFNTSYRIVKSWIKEVQPGQEVVHRYKGKPFKYDPSVDDQYVAQYYPDWSGATVLWRLEGIVGHDDADTSEVGTMGASVDIMTWSTYLITYDAGINIKFIVVDDDTDIISYTASSIANRPIAAIQKFDD